MAHRQGHTEMVAIADILALPREERLEIYKAVGESLRPHTPSVRERYDAAARAMESVTGYPLDLHTRRRESTMERAMVAYQLISEGFSTTEVGRCLQRDHSTVIHYRNMIEDMMVYARLTPNEFTTWLKFKNAIQ